MDNTNELVNESTLEATEVQAVESNESGSKNTIVDVAVKTVAGIGLFIAGAVTRPFIDKIVEKRKAKKAEKELMNKEGQETDKKKK